MHLQTHQLLAFVIFINIRQIKSEFSQDFRNFLIQFYDRAMLDKLERVDMGIGMLGSFGGKSLATDVVKNRVSVPIPEFPSMSISPDSDSYKKLNQKMEGFRCLRQIRFLKAVKENVQFLKLIFKFLSQLYLYME